MGLHVKRATPVESITLTEEIGNHRTLTVTPHQFSRGDGILVVLATGEDSVRTVVRAAFDLSDARAFAIALLELTGGRS